VTECAASVVCALFAAHRNTECKLVDLQSGVNTSARAQVFSLETRVGQEFGFALERPLASVSAKARAVVALVLLQLGEVMRHLHEI
jgi:hypothetical protein